MADFRVKVEASGFDSILYDAQRLLTHSVVKEVSNAVYADMKQALEEHVKDDVYRMYDPKMYLRRKDDPDGKLGKSLLQSAAEADQIFEVIVNGKDYAWETGLSYRPTGEHDNAAWNGVDGDLLIGRIERKDPPYNWEPRKGPKIPERPFWQLFIEELIEGGRLARVVERELKAQGIMEPEDHVSGVTRQSEDGNY